MVLTGASWCLVGMVSGYALILLTGWALARVGGRKESEAGHVG